MTTALLGVDASYDDISADDATRLYAAGIRIFCQCLWTGGAQPAPRVTNLRNAINAKLIPVGYISVTGNNTGAWHTSMGRNGVPDDIWNALALVPIDVELTGIPNATIRDAINSIFNLKGTKCVYTAYFAWHGYQGNTSDFTDCLLWNANWRGIAPDPVGQFFSELPFGGWKIHQVVGEQWSGGYNLEACYVDRDVFSKELLMPTIPIEDRVAALENQTKFLASIASALKVSLDNIKTKLKEAGSD